MAEYTKEPGSVWRRHLARPCGASRPPYRPRLLPAGLVRPSPRQSSLLWMDAARSPLLPFEAGSGPGGLAPTGTLTFRTRSLAPGFRTRHAPSGDRFRTKTDIDAYDGLPEAAPAPARQPRERGPRSSTASTEKERSRQCGTGPVPARGRVLSVRQLATAIGMEPGPVRSALSTAFPRSAPVFAVRARRLSRALSTGTGEGEACAWIAASEPPGMASHQAETGRLIGRPRPSRWEDRLRPAACADGDTTTRRWP